MIVIGLTGGIASGKSTVSREFSNLGATVIDTDVIAIKLSEIGQPIYKAYVDYFGKEILLPNGKLDRVTIGRIIFGNQKVRQDINDISHPKIKQETLRKLEEAKASGVKIVILDVPLLYEVGWESLVDKVLVVFTDYDTQLERLIKRNNYTESEAKSRIAAQMPLIDKKKIADIVIDNTNNTIDTLQQVRTIWMKLSEDEKKRY